MARVPDDEVGMVVPRADGGVEPEQAVAIQLSLRTFGEAARAPGHAADADTLNSFPKSS